MRQAAVTLIDNESILKSILIVSVGYVGMAFSFENVKGVLVGTHSLVPVVETRHILERLDLVANEWRQAGLVYTGLPVSVN